MSHRAKVFARMFGYAVPQSLSDGQMSVTIEWKILNGSRRAGKETFLVDDISSDEKLKGDIREMLSAYLTRRFAPEVFRPRDVVGYSA